MIDTLAEELREYYLISSEGNIIYVLYLKQAEDEEAHRRIDVALARQTQADIQRIIQQHPDIVFHVLVNTLPLNKIAIRHADHAARVIYQSIIEDPAIDTIAVVISSNSILHRAFKMLMRTISKKIILFENFELAQQWIQTVAKR
jgi:hypothetical protein